jgi:hypothetical protein
MPAPTVLVIVRRALFAILLLGMVGTCAELLLLKHSEGFWQLVPITLLATGVVVLAWSALANTRAASRVLVGVMVLFVAAGATGVGLHLKGNIEWELERTPDLGGLSLIAQALMGATPSLAPGTMLQFGLLGLLYGYLRRREHTHSHPDPLESRNV